MWEESVPMAAKQHRPSLLGEADLQIHGPAEAVLDVTHTALSITLLEIMDQHQADRIAHKFVARASALLADNGFTVREYE